MKNKKITTFIVVFLAIIVIILSTISIVNHNYYRTTMPIVLCSLALINIINGVSFIKDGNKTLGWTGAGAGIFMFLIVISQLFF